MAESTASKDRFATRPFKLIETPIYSEKLTKPYDQYLLSASAMALSHNVFIRGLNSIYLQAPHIRPEDHADFIAYCKCWCEILNSHHQMEEATVFPKIEEITGEKGIMDVNVEQHHAFLPGLTAFESYLATSSISPETFSGTHLNTLIDSFGAILIEHLRDEIPNLLSLSRFGSALPLLDILSTESKKAAGQLTKTQGSSFFFRNLDLGYEGGLWNNWPGVPAPVLWVLNNTVVRWNGRWWRFASCDSYGQLRELPALGD